MRCSMAVAPPEVSPPSSRFPGADAVLALVKPEVRRLHGYTLNAPDAPIKLNQNESPFDLPDAVKRTLADRVVAAPWNRYPAFVPTELTARLAERHDWVPDGVLVGNGSNELIQATFAVILRPGDLVVTPSPTFSLYQLLAGVAGARWHGVPLGTEFAWEGAPFLPAARDARVVVVCTPNNPTGTICPRSLVERLLAETEALILVDEAYQEFGGETLVPLLRESARVVVLRTFSKAFGLAGLRFGYALAHPALAAEMHKAKLPYNVNRFTLEVAGTLLDHQAVIHARVAELVDRRERTRAELGRIPGLHVHPGEANFLLIRCDAVPAATVFARLLEEAGILVRDVSQGEGLAECLRITIGTEEDMTRTCAALGAIFS